MEISKEQLRERYATLDTEELSDLVGRGTLTEEALRIARKELAGRRVEPPTHSVAPDEVSESSASGSQKNPFLRFFSGEIPLWKTFWFGMFLPTHVLNVLLREGVIGSSFAALTAGILAIGLARSAFKYRGPRGWMVASLLYTALFILFPFILSSR